MGRKKIYSLLSLFLLYSITITAQRKDLLLNTNWYTLASDSNNIAYDSLINTPSLSSAIYQLASKVTVPHTWDKYEGYRQLKHGNRHGYAWYRKEISIGKEYTGKQLFLWFEGVSSFATIWVNGKKIGTHAGGRTSFTIDITDAVVKGRLNVIAVKADHPGFIRTLPWVCGGCSEEQGFSEGSQPMGIFRPVHLVVTAPVRVEPFGVHIWNDSNITAKAAQLHTTTEVKNYTKQKQAVTVITRIIDPAGHTVHTFSVQRMLMPEQTDTIRYTTPALANPRLWSLEQPALYKAETQIVQNGKVTDETTASFGIRWVKWTLENGVGNRQLLINGKPVFLNGTAEYEHLMGNSHAFSDLEIKARAMQVHAAGFNAFRDAHQPHNLRYQHYWDSMGIAWWPQFAAHIWFDLPAFRDNFKTLLRDWIKERRNSPSIILWGLENESTLPEDFAQECTAIIREMDPTASSQRKITTCNGGTGTDWNVPQNWTGTYGGNPTEYGSDLIKQVLVGEYGAWRSIDWHTEGLFDQKGPLSEDRMTQLMEMKARLADSVKEQTTGHFHWLLYSHDNPGRVQPDEGYRYIDKVGPVNNKGLFTIWGEPTDAFYMYRANYASPATDPMVYIVSHTWPERWLTAGVKSGITVYSNCDEVELFNDMGQRVSLGKRERKGIGTHFQWDNVPVLYNILYAQAYIKGKPVARDRIVLNHLPQAPHFNECYKGAVNITAPAKGYDYLYRINCGGPGYIDQNCQKWQEDRLLQDGTYYGYGSSSWADSFAGMSSAQASQRRTFDVINGTKDWPLFQTYRYGREMLQYRFAVKKGKYLVELYFTEPWYGIGGGMDCSNWRVFDVAVNGKTVIKNLDIWKEAGTNKVVKKTVVADIADDGKLVIHFPGIQSSQAIIAAIAIAEPHKPFVPGYGTLDERMLPATWSIEQWLDKGALQHKGSPFRISYLPPLSYGDQWIQTSAITEPLNDTMMGMAYVPWTADVYIALDSSIRQLPGWLQSYTSVGDSLVNDANGGTVFRLFKKSAPARSRVIFGNNGRNATGNAQMYTIIIHHPTAYEQSEKVKRPVVTFLAQEAIHQGEGIENSIEGSTGKGYIALRHVTDTATWRMTVGVGDTYELRFRYRTGSARQIPVWLTVRAADGTLMRHDKVFFAPADTKWKTLYSSTGTNINAGNYKVQLVPASNEELYLDKLDVQ
jgi:hypothetical protein